MNILSVLVFVKNLKLSFFSFLSLRFDLSENREDYMYATLAAERTSVQSGQAGLQLLRVRVRPVRHLPRPPAERLWIPSQSVRPAAQLLAAPPAAGQPQAGPTSAATTVHRQ